MDRLQALIDVATSEEAAQFADDSRLIAIAHGQVGVFPISEDTQPFELGALDIDEALGKGAAAPADVSLTHARFLGAEFEVHLVFDG